MLQVAEVYGGDFSVGDHKNRKVERKKLPVMEVQCKARFNGAWFVGLHSTRPRNSPCSCKECFLASI